MSKSKWEKKHEEVTTHKKIFWTNIGNKPYFCILGVKNILKGPEWWCKPYSR